MYLDAAVMDMEEALRTLQLIGKTIGQFDTHMYIRGSRGDVEGESERQHAGGGRYHAILGYYLSAGTPTDGASGSASGKRRHSAMRVVRSSDSSSAILLTAFQKNDDLTVELSSYRAGGDDSKDAQPMFHFKLEHARVKTYTLMFGGALPNTGAIDIIEFAYRRIGLEAAAQTKTGQRGPLKIYDDDWTNPQA